MSEDGVIKLESGSKLSMALSESDKQTYNRIYEPNGSLANCESRVVE